MPLLDKEENNLPSLRDVVTQHGLLAKKSLGQNFLLNMDITRRIAKTAKNLLDSTVLEIGPGPGGLTRALLESGAKVVAIERDHRCLDILKEIQNAFPGRLTVIEGDALSFTPQDLVPEGDVQIIANLPYNIATLLLVQWFSNLDRISCFTLMFQKEVALRLLAKPRTKDYGRLSILTQWLCEGRRLFDLSPKAFTPSPKVTSSVVQLKPRHLTIQEQELLPTLSSLTQQAFGQRRKMIRSSMKASFTEEELIAYELNPCSRAEELSVSDFIHLAKIEFSKKRA